MDHRASKTEGQAAPGGRRPVVALLDLLGRRWTLRVLWDLRSAPRRFGELQAGEISTSVLAQRLRELEDAGVVARDAEGRYALTDRGRELGDLLLPLNDWAKRWARRRR